MPGELKPAGMQQREEKRGLLDELKSEVTKKRPVKRVVAYAVLALVVIFVLVQYINAAKYDALVQVIKEDKIGVNPTGEKLDFGDLPRDKSATRTVTLKSDGGRGAYIMIWKFGGISDLIKVSKNYFVLMPHSTEKLEFSAYIPNSAEYKYYKGKVIIFQIPKIW